MRVEIFDVEHGACALVTTDTNQHILIDCGHRAESRSTLRYQTFQSPISVADLMRSPFDNALFATGLLGESNCWRPSEELSRRGIQVIDKLVISNYDEDHVSDLPNICGKIYIAEIFGNPTITMRALRQMKAANGFRKGIETLIHLFEKEAQTFSPRPINGVYINHFWVEYHPFGAIQGTNNLSVITFLSCGNLHMIFPGDIEKPAWDLALQDNSFLAHLKRVNVFVASHHGRESGYYSDVFSNGRCSPELAIISDKSIMHGTQEGASTRYGRHVSGVLLNGQLRKVLTTRDDGTVAFDVSSNGSATVQVAA